MFTLMHGRIFSCTWLWSVKWLFVISTLQSTLSASGVYLDMDHVPVRWADYVPHRLRAAVPLQRFSAPSSRDENRDFWQSSDVLHFKPSDAKTKWSQPAVEHRNTDFLARHGQERLSNYASSPSPTDKHDFQVPSVNTYSEELLNTHLFRSTVNSIIKHHDDIEASSTETPMTEQPDELSLVSKPQLHLSRNNFTDSNDSHILVPSNSVFDYQASLMLGDEAVNQDPSPEGSDGGEQTEPDLSTHVPEATLSPINDRDALEKNANLRKRLSFTVSPDPFDPTVSYHFNSSSDPVNRVDDLASSVPTAYNTGEEFPDALPSVESTVGIRLGSGAVAGIVIAVLICVTVITSTVIYLLYRRYNGKCTNVVEGKFNSDNCGYLDDSLRSSVYLNNHIELPKENSEEMSSLDNDSFLNSLETMTIQNYWADNTKNTKV